MTTGVSETLAVARKATISGVAYSLSLNVPALKTEPIEAMEQVSFTLNDNRHPVQLDFKAPTSHLHSLTVNGQPVAIDHRNEHLVLPAAALHLGHNVAEIRLMAGELSLNRNADYLYTLLVPDRARTVFPVFDQPNLKATFNLALTVPERLAGHGQRAGAGFDRERGDTKTVHLSPPPTASAPTCFRLRPANSRALTAR